MIELKKNKPNLKLMFDNYLKELSRKEKAEYDLFNSVYRDYLIAKYGDEDEDDYDDEYDIYDGYSKGNNWKKTKQLIKQYINKGKKEKNSKRGKRGGKKQKNKTRTLHNSELNDKMIYFYRDIENPDSNVRIFYTLYDFDEFLTEEGIELSDEEAQNLMSREISHCCINPDIKATNGKVELITDNSYGGLHWQCHDDDIYINALH